MKEKISVLLAVLLVAVSFAGCGDKAKSTAEEKRTENLSRPAVSEEAEKNTEAVSSETADSEKAEDENKEEQTPDAETTSKQTDTANTAASANLSEVRTAILNACGITDQMMLETDALTRLYGIDASKVKQSASFVTMSGTFPHEIIMVEATDASAADAIAGQLQNRLSEVLNQSKSYDAHNYALAQQCRVVKNGNYISLFLSPEREKMSGVYSGYIK